MSIIRRKGGDYRSIYVSRAERYARLDSRQSDAFASDPKAGRMLKCAPRPFDMADGCYIASIVAFVLISSASFVGPSIERLQFCTEYGSLGMKCPKTTHLNLRDAIVVIIIKFGNGSGSYLVVAAFSFSLS